MTIKFACGNGHQLAVQDAAAGKSVKCPKCGDLVSVPAPDVEVIELDAEAIIRDDVEPVPIETTPPDDPFEHLPDTGPLGPVSTFPAVPVATPLVTASPTSPADAAEQDKAGEPISNSVIVAGIAAVSSLVLGLIVLTVLLISRGSEPTKVAQGNEFAASDDEKSLPWHTSEPPPAAVTESSTDPQTPSVPKQVDPNVPPVMREFSGTVHSQPIGDDRLRQHVIAMDNRTGDIATVTPGGAVMICRAEYFDGDKSARQTLKRHDRELMTALLFKRYGDQTLLLTSDGSNVWIHDASTGELIQDGDFPNPIPVGRPGLYSSQNPQDLRVFTTASEFKLGPHPFEMPIAAGDRIPISGISPSGRLVFSSGPRLNYPRNFAVNSRWFGAGNNNLYQRLTDQTDLIRPRTSSDTSERKIQESLASCIPYSPWVVTVKQGGMWLLHRQSGEVRPAMKLPDSFSKSRNTYFLDLVNDRMIILGANNLASLPLGDLGIPNEPLLAVRIDLPVVVEPEQTVRANVYAANGVELSLLDPPGDASLANGVLTWTPSYDDVGDQQLTIRCQSGAELFDQKIRVVVSVLGVELPFLVGDTRLSNDGSSALAVSSYVEKQLRFAVIDTKTKKARIGTVIGPGRATQIAFDASEVYIFTSDFELFVYDTRTLKQKQNFLVISADTLTSGSSKRSSFGNVRLTSDHLVIEQDNHVQYFRRSDLEPVESLRPIDDKQHPARVRLASHQVQVGPAVFDSEGESFQYFRRIPHVIPTNGSIYYDTQPTEFKSIQKNTVFAGKLKVSPQIEDGTLRLGGEHSKVIRCAEKTEFTTMAANDCIAITMNQALFLFHPYESELLTRPVDEQETATRLTIKPESVPKVLSASGPTQLNYEAIGGTRPYKFTALLNGVRIHRGEESLIRIDPQTGKAIVDGPALTMHLMRTPNDALDLLRNMIKMPSNHGNDLDNAIENYRIEATNAVSVYTNHTFNEFPLAVAITVQVTDAEQQAAVLQHQVAIELPANQLVAMATTIGAPLEPKLAPAPLNAPRTIPQMYSVESGAKHGLQFIAAGENRRTDFFAALNQHGLNDGLDSLALNHRALFHLIPKSQIRRSRNQQPNTWKLTSGEEIVGTIVSLSRTTTEINTENRQRRVPTSELSYESLRTIFNEHVRQEFDFSSSSRRIAEAMELFRILNGILLPSSIDDADERPLLSWRVLLLPQLGYSGLFSLFRLDEPWDSPHNRKLIPYMPKEYRICEEIDQPGFTNLEILTGEKTLFPSDRVIRTSSIDSDACHRLVIAVLQKKELACEWTKPNAIPTDEEIVPYDALRVVGTRYAGETESLMSFSGSIVKAGPKPGVEADRIIYSNRKPQQHRIFLPKPR